ncbi:MAG: YggS family pyridoxal phosphate-dependent enzyme [Pirellulales bacterium]
MSRLLENLARVRERIAAAARCSGRLPEDITLVAVTKYAADDLVYELVEAGCRDLGEARPQALRAKAAALAASSAHHNAELTTVRWHLVGHLQRNKVETTLPLVSLIHSADSVRLLQAIDEAAARQDRRVPVLIEVNVSGDATKHGFTAEDVARALSSIAALDHVSVRGLMCMAAREGDDVVARGNFAALREIRDQLRRERPEDVSLDELSMGMSGDYEIAIEEGATIVRVGSALFEGLEP